MTTLLLVHGAWCGAWAYWKLAPELDARGVRWIGADLPSCGANDASIGPFDDVAYVRDLIDDADDELVVVGKSYGGTVITGATAGARNVRHLVYVAAMMPAVDEPFQQTTSAARTAAFAKGGRALEDGRVAMDPEIGAACAFSQADEPDRDVWRAHNRPMSFGRDFAVAFSEVGWTDIPSTYVVCTEDRALEVSAHRSWARHATRVIERPWDHSPGVSHPAEVADLLAEIAAGPTR